MIDSPIISHSNVDAASLRQPFRNLQNAIPWHTEAMIDRSLISNTHRVTDPGVVPTRMTGHQPATVTQSESQPLGIETSARALALLESINCRLREVLRGQATSQVAPIDLNQAYTLTQATRLLGVSTWTIDKGRKAGLLIEARRIGQRDVRITGESLVRFMKERESASVHVRKM